MFIIMAALIDLFCLRICTYVSQGLGTKDESFTNEIFKIIFWITSGILSQPLVGFFLLSSDDVLFKCWCLEESEIFFRHSAIVSRIAS